MIQPPLGGANVNGNVADRVIGDGRDVEVIDAGNDDRPLDGGGRDRVILRDGVAIIVDDGLATGLTMFGASAGGSGVGFTASLLAGN